MRFTLYLYLLLTTTTLFAQTFKTQDITVADGLSQGMIMSIIQDKKGFMWFATRGGLNRFDGYRFKHYTHKDNDTASITENIVGSLCEDAHGRIWVITENNGIDCFDPQTEIFHHLGFGFNTFNLPNPRPLFLNRTADGHIWVNTATSITEIIVPDAIKNIADTRYKMYVMGQNLPCKAVGWLYPSLLPDGTISVSTSSNECLWFNPKTETWLHHAVEPQLANNGEVVPIFGSAYDGSLWYVAKGRLQHWKAGQVLLNAPIPLPFINNGNDALLPDKMGNLWVVLSYRLFFVSAQSLVQGAPVFKPIIEQPHCKSIYLDRQEQLWLGTTGYGIRSLPTNKPVMAHWLPNASIIAMDRYQNDQIFVRTGGYWHALNDRGEEKTAAPIFDKWTMSISHTRDGTIYRRHSNPKALLQTYLSVFPNPTQPMTRSTPLQYTASPADPQITDHNDNTWLTCMDAKIGCLWAGDKTVTYYDYRHLWKNTHIIIVPKTIYESKNGTLWVCTSHGLVEMTVLPNRDVKFRLVQTNVGNPLSSNSILSVLDDPSVPDRFLWVGTNGGGLNKMDKQTGACVTYTKEDGLPDNVIYGILPDDKGNLWLSTNFGLSRFNPTKNHFRNYTAAQDDLQDNEFNTGAYMKHPDGRLLFGGVSGISVFNPHDFQPDTTFAPVLFTALKINNNPVILRGDNSTSILMQPLELTQRLDLKHNQNFITLSFAALDFKQMGKSSYFYKMEGVDADWVFAGEKTEVSYPNLSAGTYTLYVANVNEAGDRNPNPAVMTVVIAAPWYRTWLAYLVYAFIIGGLIYRFFTFRLHEAQLNNDLLFKDKEAKNLQELDELKNRFFTNVTHEFRTPLTLIIEPARQLQHTTDLDLIHLQSGIIFNNANRLLLLVNQLLDVSKLEDGKMKLHLADGDILPMLKEIFDYFLPLADKKQQKLLWNSAVTVLNGVVDRQILEKIVYNLLSNAHKFTPVGGTITVNIYQPDAEHWQMSITDTGVGIASNDLPRIFDRFYQTDGSHTRQGEGTGIGLALVKELMDLAQGTIAVQSKQGQGTQFILTFPLRLAGDIEAITLPQTHSNLIKEVTTPLSISPILTPENADNSFQITILIVEDNDEMRQYLRLILQQNGYATLEAVDGEEGIEKAREALPDIILSDVMMPKKDGFALTSTLKNDLLTAHIPIVLLTAKGRLESKMEGYKRGADAYLPKPFHTQELLIRLQQLLAMRQALQTHYTTLILPLAEKKQIERGENDKTTPHQAVETTETTEETGLSMSDLDRDWLAILQKRVQENIHSEQFLVEDLAVEFTMSRTQFYAKMKALTGLTPARFVRNIRMTAAYHLVVTQPQLRVVEVMYQVGLNDIKNFTATFKEQFGQTPRDVRGSNHGQLTDDV
jgi:signal transduction histidine kinase/DNA-binding response OmpR family regulator/sugar lactone lactonase YvrE